ncbi:hypothetical protein [Paenibacillus naphthalenovorans]|uniref:hypothetical protein n=1 Tax=Paenibacillus naphthalenovorans TaxID=162209 RepID=UPI003D2C1FE5
MYDISKFSARSGRIIKEDGSVVNEAEGLLLDGTRKVANYIQTAGGIWVPQKAADDGTVLMQVTSSLPLLDSTTIALGASGTYTTPTAFDASKFKYIAGSVFSDQAGTLIIRQSWDGTNWDVKDSVSVTAGTTAKFEISVVAPLGSLEYVNGATAQTVFRLFAGGKSH